MSYVPSIDSFSRLSVFTLNDRILTYEIVGYNFQCDVQQLARSYPDLQCFEQYEMILDIQNVFKEPKGGLSGLSEVIFVFGR